MQVSLLRYYYYDINRTTQTQPAIARITKAGVVQTQTALANINANLTTTKTQTALANLRNTTLKTQPALANLRNTTLKTQLALARIQAPGTGGGILGLVDVESGFGPFNNNVSSGVSLGGF